MSNRSDWRYGPYGPPTSGPSSQSKPSQRITVEQRVVGLLGVPGGVGVLDPEDEGAAVVPREGPVEQGGAGQPDVRGAGRGRAEPDADGGAVSHA